MEGTPNFEKLLQICKNVDNSIALNFSKGFLKQDRERRRYLISKMKKHSISGAYIFQEILQKRNLIYYVMVQSIYWKLKKILRVFLTILY